MGKLFIKFSSLLGLSIFIVYRIVSHYTQVSDYIAYPAFVISITLMLIGAVYNGWCLGKRKNPFK